MSLCPLVAGLRFLTANGDPQLSIRCQGSKGPAKAMGYTNWQLAQIREDWQREGGKDLYPHISTLQTGLRCYDSFNNKHLLSTRALSPMFFTMFFRQLRHNRHLTGLGPVRLKPEAENFCRSRKGDRDLNDSLANQQYGHQSVMHQER